MRGQITKQSNRPDFHRLLAEAGKLERACRCCERRCGIDRQAGERGYCGVGPRPELMKFFITHGEEAAINPARMVYTAGCNFRCAYCTNYEFLEPASRNGCREYRPLELARQIDADFRDGRIKAVQLLGGEAGCCLSGSIELASLLTSGVPVVWNSNFYFTLEAFALIREFTDFYIADFKFGNDACAEELANVPDYVAVIRRNLREVEPERLLVRQLPLRGHLECCTRPVVEFLAKELPEVPVNFNELLPDARGRCRNPDEKEKRRLTELVKKSGLKRIHSVLQEGHPLDAGGFFSGEILIRADGSIAIQDMSREIMELLTELGVKEKIADE